MNYILEDEEQMSMFDSSSGLRQKARFLAYFQQEVGVTEHFLHHKTRNDLELSAALGCHLCSLATNARWSPNAEFGRYSDDDDGDGDDDKGEELKEEEEDDHKDDDDDEKPRDKQKDKEHGEAGKKNPGVAIANPTELMNPTEPDVLDQIHALITPFDSDYIGTPASEEDFWFIREGKWENLNSKVTKPEDAKSKESPGPEAQSVIRGKDFKKLKSGVWCDIFIRWGPFSEYRMSFKEYGGPSGNQIADGFSVIRRQGELNRTGK
jgi:hypothetical protein